MPTHKRRSNLVDAVEWTATTKHPKVSRTSYTEVAQLLGTSGCSHSPECWSWHVLGMIHTPTGKQIVRPGDWVITEASGEVYAIDPEAFRRQFDQVTF
jgi:hypothetical protein